MKVRRRKLAELTPYARNPRRIDTGAVAAVAASLTRFGWQQPLVVDPHDVIVVGHTRRLAALELGLTTAPVVTISAEHAAAYRLVDNRTGELSSWDTELLAGELSAIEDLEAFDFGSLLPAAHTTADDVPDPPTRPVSTRGMLWTLGDHRLLCGDATDPKDVARAIGGGRPTLLVTDPPPYGVRYDPGWRNREPVGGGWSSRSQKRYPARTGRVVNDHLADWSPALRCAGSIAVAYVWAASTHAIESAGMLATCAFEIRAEIVWVKPHFAISRGHYHWQHEICWYAVRRGAAAAWTGGRKQSTVWPIDRAVDANQRSEGGVGAHGTVKPIECMARPIRHHTGDVYDPFVGAGTTILAGEQESRSVSALEIEPGYVDVAVERWQQLTGKKARRRAA